MVAQRISMSTGINGVRFVHRILSSENGDLSFLLFLSKQCLVEKT